MQSRLAPLLSRALIPQPVTKHPEDNEREPDLLRLSHPASAFDPRRIEEIMHQTR